MTDMAHTQYRAFKFVDKWSVFCNKPRMEAYEMHISASTYLCLSAGVNLAMARSTAGQQLDLINIMAYDAGNLASTGGYVCRKATDSCTMAVDVCTLT